MTPMDLPKTVDIAHGSIANIRDGSQLNIGRCEGAQYMPYQGGLDTSGQRRYDPGLGRMERKRAQDGIEHVRWPNASPRPPGSGADARA
jgi:hypothetical protein